MKIWKPDKAEAVRRAHEAAKHDTWFREQVQAALDDPRASVPHDEAVATMEKTLADHIGPRPQRS